LLGFAQLLGLTHNGGICDYRDFGQLILFFLFVTYCLQLLVLLVTVARVGS
jgi:hypothetical protein